MKILIAEDDQYTRDGLTTIVNEEGYSAIACGDGKQALQVFKDQRPQVVLLDIMMPGADGYSVCKEIRKIDNDVPIIFISAKSEEIDRVVGLELGADDYILKPFGKREVIARIRAVTRRSLARNTNTNKNEMIKLRDLEVYPRELCAKRGSQQIELSLRDVTILQTLFQHRGKTVDRDTFFNECWGRDYLPSSRTLDQHISKLRKLIEIDPADPKIIRTVHGIGYRYDE